VQHFGDCEVAIGATRDYNLPWRQPELFAIESYRNNIRFERHQTRDSSNLGICLTIRPYSQMCVTNVIIAAQPPVGTEGLRFHRCQLRLVDVRSWDVTARRESGFVES
jgi:hypothetical protein